MTEDSLRIPYGVTDFAMMRRDGYYHVDKTRFIQYAIVFRGWKCMVRRCDIR